MTVLPGRAVSADKTSLASVCAASAGSSPTARQQSGSSRFSVCTLI